MEYLIENGVQLLIAVLSGGVLTWFFGGRQKNKNDVDNDSHQREKEFFDLVDKRTEREINKNMKRVIKCAKHCNHSINCPVLINWEDEVEDNGK